MEYTVSWCEVMSMCAHVRADSEEEAIERALEMPLPDLWIMETIDQNDFDVEEGW